MAILNKLLMVHASDADLQTKMEGIKFSTTIMEAVTIEDMENYYWATEGSAV